MSQITGAQLTAITDEVARFHLRAIGAAPTSTYGLGNSADTDKCRLALSNLNTAILAVADIDFVAALAPGLSQAEALATADSVTLATFSELYRRLEAVIGSYQIPNAITFQDFVRYLNVGQVTKWQALLHPDWYALLPLIRQNTTFKPCLFYQVATLGTRTAGVFADGTAIDGTKYAGGYLAIDVASFGGAQAIGVVGTCFDPADETTKACTWSGNITGNITGQLLTPSVANALAVDVASTTGASSGETVTIKAIAPAGRPVLP